MEQDEFDYEQYNNENNYEHNERESEEEAIESYDHNAFSHDGPMDEVYIYQSQEQPFEILPLEKLYHELNQILDEVQGLICLDKGWCLILLKEFKWDKDYLREEYYNNMEVYLKKIEFSPALQNPLDIDRSVKGICDVCCQGQVSLYHNICGHSFCLECWASHLKNSIMGGSVFPRCMDSQCFRPVLLETILGILKLYGPEGQTWLKKYEKKLCEYFITINRNYQFCTGADCGNCIKVNMQLDTVECACSKVFCFRCQSDDHYPCKCEEKARWIEQVMKEEADAKWISQNAKICPWCKKAVERSMGCNFMACRCGKNFCYMCSHPWQPDHKDHFKCHIFKKKGDDVINREKEVMERMNHCTQRYIFNQACANKYKEIDVFAKRKYLFKALHIDLTESEFMEHAYRFATQCCEKLKWIYAFTYFYELKQGKDAFEFSLGQYERYKENLLKLIAVDLQKNFMKTVEDCDQACNLNDQMVIEQLTETFISLKKQIVNYYTCTKNFKEKFLKEVKNITAILDEEKERAEMEAFINKPPPKTNSNEKTEEKGMKHKKSKRNIAEV